MILHAFFTDGLFPWGRFFVESFRFSNGSEAKIVLCTRNLTNTQIDELYSISDNIVVKNEHIDLEVLSKEWGITMERLLYCKNQIERVHITDDARIWKQYTSADQRIRSIYDVMREYKDEDYILHLDIDMYFRKKLDPLYALIEANDISIRFRLHTPTGDHRKVMGGLLGLKINDYVFKFMERWIKYLDDVPIPERKIGYGQTSLYYAYRDLINDYSWGDVPPEFISPFFKDTDYIWSANTYAGKTKNLVTCREDMERLKGELNG